MSRQDIYREIAAAIKELKEKSRHLKKIKEILGLAGDGEAVEAVHALREFLEFLSFQFGVEGWGELTVKAKIQLLKSGLEIKLKELKEFQNDFRLLVVKDYPVGPAVEEPQQALEMLRKFLTRLTEAAEADGESSSLLSFLELIEKRNTEHIVCPSCERINPKTHKFCSNCGAGLGQAQQMPKTRWLDLDPFNLNLGRDDGIKTPPEKVKDITPKKSLAPTIPAAPKIIAPPLPQTNTPSGAWGTKICKNGHRNHVSQKECGQCGVNL